VVVVVDELGLPPTSALCVPFWLPASEKLLPESEVDQVVVPPLLLPLALLMEATILVMGVVSVDIVFDCTYMRHVLVANVKCARGPAQRSCAFMLLTC
jgi:hypothetical protein